VNKLLIQTNRFVFDRLKELPDVSGVKHMNITLNYSKLITEQEGASIVLSSLCSILHDIGMQTETNFSIETIDDNHGIEGARIAKNYLEKQNVPAKDICIICTAIERHCFPEIQESIYDRILWDADKLNLFSEDMYNIYLDYFKKQKKITKMEAKTWIKNAQMFYSETFYTNTAKTIASEVLNEKY